MRREQKLLVAFCAAVLIPVGIVWFMAWPLLHAWHLPVVTGGKMIVPEARGLTAQDVQGVNLWLQSHTTGWGPRGDKPFKPGDVIVRMVDAEGHPVVISLWKHGHQPDVVGIQLEDGGLYRMNSYEDASLRVLQPGLK